MAGADMTTNNTTLRDELEIRRRRVLNEIDRIADSWLHGRLNWRRRIELVDHIERALARRRSRCLARASTALKRLVFQKEDQHA
jgi:hypothetical protein